MGEVDEQVQPCPRRGKEEEIESVIDMPKKEVTNNEATKVVIDIHVYIHFEPEPMGTRPAPGETSIVRAGKPGGFMDAMSKYAREGKG